MGFDVPEHMDFEDREFDTVDEDWNDFEDPDDGERPQTNWNVVAQEKIARLNTGQRQILDEVSAAIDLGQYAANRLFFVTGAGGTGKTCLFNTMIAKVKSDGGFYVATATTGIASLLLTGGKTAHRAFRIRNDIDENSVPTIEYESPFAVAIRESSFILIDEVSMLHVNVFNYINKVVLSVVPSEYRNMPFGGKVVLMSGDFKQLAPVAKGEGMDGQIMASIRHSELFVYFKHLKLTENMRARNEVDFIKWLTAVGNGENMYDEDLPYIAIPPECKSSNLEELVDFCFPNNSLEDPLEKIDDLKGSMILCTKNDTVFTINDMLLDKIPNEERVFKSIDTPILDPEGAAAALLDVHAEDYNVESINKLTPTGLPPHHLRLKVGAIVMVIRNISGADGLCNGTMLQITEIHSDIIKCRRLEEDDRFDQVVYLPRIKFEYGTGENDRTVKFRRIQFPIRLAFANTINKAQGQTLQRLGLYLYGQEAFSHGQIYTALSRVRTMSSIRVLKLGLPMPSYLLNVVYYELLLPK
ncbi:hypothetical protein QR680_003524 [Steinernema hermaphroditum]|uniref:ATP-dependent DNA helicase n=1 Tax=Steinernema hermaphroditum TaxID=289476 RepID=A0AA39HKQ2_9BILA|nr:hypothetical protein QR680_003524 [Steinernema hermaphroditum]